MDDKSGFTYYNSIQVSGRVKLPVKSLGCNCSGNCAYSKTYSCVTLNGSNLPYIHRDRGRLIEPKAVVYEYGPNCGCEPGCVNWISQRRKTQCVIVDIDAADANNELAAIEYVDDMYKFYKLVENETRVFDYILSQPEISGKMRAILVDWLIEVHNKFDLMPETLYLTINIIDRYLATKTVTRKELQLLSISSMLTASKYEEIWAPEVNDFTKISDNAYTNQVLVMEKKILGGLEWNLTVPTPYEHMYAN
ncbi:hypothetical protein AgCh_017954 [Apium graveolens]